MIWRRIGVSGGAVVNTVMNLRVPENVVQTRPAALSELGALGRA
jgi:hypothetical protein